MASKNLNLLKHWLPLAIASTLILGTVYATVQQNYRQSANDPQIQMAEDTAVLLNSGGKTPSQLVPAAPIDPSASLAPFMIIYDKNGQVLASSATLNGSTPVLPSGIFSYVAQHGEHYFTWQPRDDARIAAVVASYDGGYVLAGRSLRVVEKREDALNEMVLIAWIATITSTLLMSISTHFYQRLLKS